VTEESLCLADPFIQGAAARLHRGEGYAVDVTERLRQVWRLRQEARDDQFFQGSGRQPFVFHPLGCCRIRRPEEAENITFSQSKGDLARTVCLEPGLSRPHITYS